MAPDTVVLDGSTAKLPWPLELGEDLLADASAWGPVVTGLDDSRYADVWRRAACVDAYHQHLADRWWDAARHSDRRYYRVTTADHQVFELYHDTVSGAWVLDIVHD